MHFIKKKFQYFKNKNVTSEKFFINRRKLLLGLTGSLALSNFSKSLADTLSKNSFEKIIERKPTSFEKIAKYNNFFEFGTTKQIWKQAQSLNTENWKIEIVGSNNFKGSISLDDILKKVEIEERIYKFRCVEAWSMIVPWYGFELSSLIKILDPKPDSKYVEFETFFRPDEATNQKQNWYPWPYKEIITIEEAMNPLTFIATGVYGNPLPKQNGAPIRLVIPWKYGFKSIKSIVKIKFSNTKENSFWQTIAPKEYGFWANVNPKVPHRRWSQEYERDIETGNRYPTKLFNGYEEWVSQLYLNKKNNSIFY